MIWKKIKLALFALGLGFPLICSSTLVFLYFGLCLESVGIGHVEFGNIWFMFILTLVLTIWGFISLSYLARFIELKKNKLKGGKK